MPATEERARDRFRAFPLDGALLFFQPSSGTQLRLENARTRAITRRAPRVVMFGITNRCNLSCSFCSRDASLASAWTVESAANVLAGLSSAGTLEVAFGGGEPFAFRGFAELVQELYGTTQLALNVTTNGTLLDARSFAPFRDLLGQIRISIYDDERWLVAARTLSDVGQLWGANVLVDDRRLPELPALLARLAALGCHDVSLLGYIGGDPSLELSETGRARLAALIEDAPLPCRLSVCFGDRVTSHRLFDGADDSGDCGAGRDFITLTPDRRVQSCSFQDQGLLADTAERVLEIWRERQTELARASSRRGCARSLPVAPRRRTPSASPSVALWRAFSGNNSGECVLVGKFESSDDAQRFLAELTPTWSSEDDEYSAEWRALFEREKVALSVSRDDGEPFGKSPSSLIAVGRSVIATSYDAGDAFPDLRALTWKRAGFVVPGGIHLHDGPSLLAAIRGRDADDVRSLAERFGSLEVFPHGDVLFVHAPEATREESRLEEHARLLTEVSAGRPLGAELVLDEWDPAAFLAAKQRLGSELETNPRLFVTFFGTSRIDEAARLAGELGEATTTPCAGSVLIEGVARRKRAAVLALRRGATVQALDSDEVEVHASFWFLDPPTPRGAPRPPKRTIFVDSLRRELALSLGAKLHVDPGPNWRAGGAQARITTGEPARVLVTLAAAARALGSELSPWVNDLDPLAHLLRRLLANLR